MHTTDGASGIWFEEFKIHSYEIGPSGCASPQAICRFLQEAASNHASNLDVSAEEMAGHNQMWVLSNLSVRMTGYPRWHDSVCIKTWPVLKGSAVRGYRDFTIGDQNDQVLGRASSMWLLLNRENRRPLKIPNWLMEVAGAGHEVEILHQVKEEDFTESARFRRNSLLAVATSIGTCT
jgi:medium-chain acyl-[acyl-carrier-protein] hydrolase